MPYMYYGLEPRNRGATKLAVKTDSGELEPAQPSNVKSFTQALYVPIWSLLTGLLGLAVAVLSFPKYSYVHWSAEGLLFRPAPRYLPFKFPGLAVVMKKGVVTSEEWGKNLETAGFTSMQFQGRTVWLKDEADKDDFLTVDTMAGVDPHGPAPARFLNTHAFRAFLTTLSFTSRLSQLLHHLAVAGSPYPVVKHKEVSKLSGGWVNARDLGNDEPVAPMATVLTPTFEDTDEREPGSSSERQAKALLYSVGSSDLPALSNPGVVANTLNMEYAGFINSGDIAAIHSHGIIAKFSHRLAQPDPNLIGDIIGRHFLAALGDSFDEQLENLDLIKTGIAGLRLTRLGDELAHLYKSIDIAIGCYAGCIPIFTGSVYEGALIMGGPGGSVYCGRRRFPFIPKAQLKDEFLNVSDHVSSLASISNYFPSGDRASVLATQSMVGLRKLCLELEVNADSKDDITRKASMLDFGSPSWVIQPANLKSCFELISNMSMLDETYPIGRLALFSRDPVLVALSCFGEKSSPSWDIPNGTACSLKKRVPPMPPMPNQKVKSSRGEISDAAWVMVIRTTDLFSAVDEFRKMASTLSYRSSASKLAKTVGHRVFSRERMNEFWLPMREALRTVNPLVEFEDADISLKRGATDSITQDSSGGGASIGKKRRIGF